MNAICLAIDRLHCGYLGAYGNTWVDTPAFDQLATDSLVFDQAMIDTPKLNEFYRSLWRSGHALAGDTAGKTMIDMLSDAGIATALISDVPEVCNHPLADGFDYTVAIDPPWQTQMAEAGAFEETHLARCFVEITDWLRTARGPFLLFCHIGSLGMIWDAPLEFRERFWDEGDPPPLETADVPDCMLDADADPDELLRYAQAYAGQLSLFDTCLSALVEAIDEHPLGNDTLLALLGTRGFPMGEHLRLGPCDESLYAELVQVPLLLRSRATIADPARSQRLVEPADVAATLLTGCGCSVKLPNVGSSLLDATGKEINGAPHDRIVAMGSEGARAIRTPAWFLRCGPERGVGPVELYVKPDDRWEANNVAVRCGGVVEGLLDALEQYERAAENGTLHDLPPLEAVLVEGLE
jgi:arylsulfatase A-like enzyme